MGMAVDSFRPDRWEVIGALVCVAGVSVPCTRLAANNFRP
jgi:drug/metabolite transporter superfamily protein YnfA